MDSAEENNSSRRPVTQKDVARLAGVSTAVVSYVINDGPRQVSAETRRKVYDAIRQLGYYPNHDARNLTLNANENFAQDRIGIILGQTFEGMTRPFYSEILKGVYEQAHRLDLKIRFSLMMHQLKHPLFLHELLNPNEVSGLLLFSVHRAYDPQYPALVERITQLFSNIVCVEQGIDHLPGVIVDYAEAARKAVSHLISLGHKRIAYVGIQYVDDKRFDSYKLTLTAHNLECTPQLYDYNCRTNAPIEAYEQAKRLFTSSSRPTAIFAACDEVAMGVLRAAHEYGIRIPEDIALASVDDLEIAQFTSPQLTTVRTERTELGAEAVRYLIQRSASPETEPAQIVIPSTLVVRESCGTQLGMKRKELASS